MPVILGGNTGIYLASLAPSVDPDAQAFITAAAITDPTQQSAINQLVVDLKGYNIWSKMKALYPFVGGTATTHKFNLKDPRDLDAAFRLQFIGSWTHSNAGALQNAFCYADTKFTPSGNVTATSAHHSAYLRVNRTIAQQAAYGSYTGTTADMQLYPYTFNIGWINDLFDNSQSRISVNTGNSTGFILGSRASSSSHKLFRNGSQIAATTNNTNGTPPNIPYFIGAVNLNSVVSFYDVQQFAFYSIGDGLTDTEAANFYTAVQAFQVTLGRTIGPQTVSDADAQAFVTNAGIVDQVEANAINNLVIGLKADGLWTKMKAIYPIVGGTASTHKWNLKDPRDLDAAFRLTFATGWTHSSTGMTPLNTYADTKLFASTQLGLNSTHVAVYSRSNTDILAPAISNWTGAANYETSLWLRATNLSYLRVNTPTASTQATTDSRGTFIGNRNSSTQQQLMIRGTRYDFSVNSNSLNSTVNYQLGGSSTGAGPTFFDNKQLAFASIGDGLTNTEMTNLTTRIDNFQLALNRNV